MAEQPSPELSTAQIEQTIRRLRDVISARVIADGPGAIQEIHVLVDTVRNAKQLARDIESALISELGVRIDHRKISIAQIRGAERPAVENRIRLQNLAFQVDRRRAEARVTLSRGEESFTGVANAAAGHYDRPRLAALATIGSLEGCLRGSVGEDDDCPRLSLEEVVTTHSVGDQAFVLVLIKLIEARGEESLLGAAMVRDDPCWAAACATLDAVNRRLNAVIEA